MKKYQQEILNGLSMIGLDGRKFIFFIRGIPWYIKTLIEIKRQLTDQDFKITKIYPVLDERLTSSGTMSGHYFHQDLLVSKKIYKYNPQKHVDIASRIDGFVAHVASFREIEVFDIRKQHSKVGNIIFQQLDITAIVPQELVEYSDSISSLHAIEHFGLGRYGDSIDANGHLKALDNIYKILRYAGKFYFSVPIGNQRIEFNAHRIFNVKYLLNIFKGKYKIDSFSFVNDRGDLFENVQLTDEDTNNNFGCHHGCGIFEMTKL